MSESVAVAVKVYAASSLIVAEDGTPERTGAELTSFTVRLIAASVFVVLSLTRTVRLSTPGPWVSVGVSVMTPLAVAVKVYADSSLIVAELGTLLRVGAVFGSSLTIVPRPWLSVIVALVALDRLTKKVSSFSTVVSPLTLTVIVLEVWPGVKVSVP